MSPSEARRQCSLTPYMVKWWRPSGRINYRRFWSLADAVRWANVTEALGYYTEYPRIV